MLDQLSFLTVCDLRWKKPILTTELICLSNFKPESKITLRLFAWDLNSVTEARGTRQTRW